MVCFTNVTSRFGVCRFSGNVLATTSSVPILMMNSLRKLHCLNAAFQSVINYSFSQERHTKELWQIQKRSILWDLD